MPPSLSEWVAAGHLAHFISDSVEQLDLSALYERHEKRAGGRGQLAYAPRLMLKLLIYAYAVGIFSSRKIARALEELVPLRMLAAGNRPRHRSLARFREEHLAQFEQLFAQVVRIAHGAGLVKMGTLAVDGSKVKANASKLHAMNYGHMKAAEQKLREEIARITGGVGLFRFQPLHRRANLRQPGLALLKFLSHLVAPQLGPNLLDS